MVLGSVILASLAGLSALAVSLVTGNSFFVSMMLYALVGSVVLAATAIWSVLGPWLDGGPDEHGVTNHAHRPTAP